MDKSSTKLLDPSAKGKAINEKIKEKKHDPRKVNEWLKLFTREGTAIKFSTHIWDDLSLYSSYDDFITDLDDEKRTYKIKELQHYNANLFWQKIYPFLFQNKLTSRELTEDANFGWGKYAIRIGWQYPSIIKKWCEVHFDDKGDSAAQPFSMKLPEGLVGKNVPGKTIQYFADVVELFKQEIEYRNLDLYVAVEHAFEDILSGFEVCGDGLISLKGCNFYTNTQVITSAIRRMFTMIKNRPGSKTIKLHCTLDSKLREYHLIIVHLNSYSDKELEHPKWSLENGSGDLARLRNTLMSLCDFSIESRFKGTQGEATYARIDYLYDGVDRQNLNPRKILLSETVDGFTFKMKFPV